jgi:hypothetical protein
MLKLLAALAAALALVAASPARACDDCKNCPHHQQEASAKLAGTVVAESDKKDAKTCGCDHSDKKACKCGDKCQCADCPVHGKGAKKVDQKG